MLTVFIRAKEGYKFALTQIGFETPRIRAKFDAASSSKARYEKAVPKSWLDNDYVVEVSKDE